MAEQRRDPRSAIAVTCDCEGASNATTTNISRHGLRLSGPMHAKVGDRFVIRVDVEGGLTLSTQVRHTTGGDVGLEIDEPNPNWVRWVVACGGEQRQSPRQAREVLVWLKADEGVIGMLTANISGCGAYFLSSSAFQPGQVLEVEVVDDANNTLPLRCEVVHQGDRGFGVRFIDLTDEHRRHLEKLLEST